MNRYEILLPPEVLAVVGKEMNIYFSNVILGELTDCYVEVRCEIGRHQNERWTVVPSTPGDYPLTIQLYGSDQITVIFSASTVIKVTESKVVAEDQAQTLLFIGDSTTAAGHYTQEVLNLFQGDAQRIELIGKQGKAPNVHEGRGNWKLSDYVDREDSPFVYAGDFDFGRYMQTNGYTKVDVVCLHLGINDVYPAMNDTDIQSVVDNGMDMLDKIVTSIHAYNRRIVVGLMVPIPPARDQDSFGSSYGTSQNAWRYRRNLFQWNKAQISRFRHRQAQGVYLVPVHVNLDTVHNMKLEPMPANSRSSRVIFRQSDAVHPAVEGYGQMADVVYAWLNRIGHTGFTAEGENQG